MNITRIGSFLLRGKSRDTRVLNILFVSVCGPCSIELKKE